MKKHNKLTYIKIIFILGLCTMFWVSVCSAKVESNSADLAYVAQIYKGASYTAKIPDTLDLQQRCSIAADCVTSVVNPENNYCLYFNLSFGRDPAYMGFNQWPGCTTKFMEVLPALRVASGNLINPDCEKSWVDWMLKEKMLSMRTISAVGLYYKLTSDIKYKDAGIEMYNSYFKCLKFEDSIAYYPIQQKKPGADIITDPNRDFHGYLWLGDSFVKFGNLADFPQAIELAGKLTRNEMSDKSYYYFNHHDGSFADESIMWYGVINKQHTHCNTLMRLSALEYGIASKDANIISWVNKGYEYAKERGEPITGWFPEAMTGSVNAVYNISEMCAVGDMVQLAVRLAQSGYDNCWDDADRWVRNALAEGQLTDVSWLKKYLDSDFCKAATAYDVERLPAGKTLAQKIKDDNPEAVFDKAAEKNIGGFGGWVAFNDWYGGYNLPKGPAIMHCCTGNCSRALYSVWCNMLSFNEADKSLKINLLLNRASKYADIDSHIPYNGRVDIKLKQDLKLEVRMPDYVTLNDVKVTVDSKPADVAFNARYAQIKNVKKGQTVTVTFPLKEETKTVRLRYYEPTFYIAEYYTLKMKGNTVIDISPKGKWCPLYQRDKYKSSETKYIDAQRFVCDKELPW
jgi:hypothetical protein